MSTKKNKVKFNICNVHYALITVDDDGEVTLWDAGGYAGRSIPVPGAKRRAVQLLCGWVCLLNDLQ